MGRRAGGGGEGETSRPRGIRIRDPQREQRWFRNGRVNYIPRVGDGTKGCCDAICKQTFQLFNEESRGETGRFLFDSLKLPPITGRAMYPRAESPADFKKEKSTDICIITGRIRAKRMSGGNFKANSRGRIGFWMISRRDVWCSFYTKVFFFCSLKNADSGFFICTDTFIGENVEWKVGLKKRGRLGSSLYFFASKIVWNHNLTYRFTLDILRSEINIKTQ